MVYQQAFGCIQLKIKIMAFPVIASYSSGSVPLVAASKTHTLSMPSSISSGDGLFVFLSISGGSNEAYIMLDDSSWNFIDIYKSDKNPSYTSRFIVYSAYAEGGGYDALRIITASSPLTPVLTTISYVVLRITGVSTAGIYGRPFHVVSPYNLTYYNNTSSSSWVTPQCPTYSMSGSDDYLYLIGMSTGDASPSLIGTSYTGYVKIDGSEYTPMTYIGSASNNTPNISSFFVSMGGTFSGNVVVIKLYPSSMDQIEYPEDPGFGIYVNGGSVSKV